VESASRFVDRNLRLNIVLIGAAKRTGLFGANQQLTRLIDFGASITSSECVGGRTDRYRSIAEAGEEVKYNATTVDLVGY
jgi:hypothetical protein